MWNLVSLSDDTKFRIVVGEHVVGRKDCEILIPGDQSISRKHATLTVTHPPVNLSQPHKLPVLTLKDSSKFGTVVQGVQMKGQETILNNGDRVKFGTQESKFRVMYEPLIVTMSCLDSASKKHLKTLVCGLGGHVVNEWRKDCGLLVMSHLSVTVKVICALVSLKPVVLPGYLEKLHEAMVANQPPPDPESFIPPLAEPESQLDAQEVSFTTNKNRSSLFQGKIFIFLSTKQFKKLSLAVEQAGGTPILMEEGSDDNDDSILTQPGTCVMLCDPNDASHNLSANAKEWIAHVFKYLKKHRQRAIPDSELGYAVLYCSTERFCNPDREPVNLFGRVASQSLSQQVGQSLTDQPHVLAPNTNISPTTSPPISTKGEGDGPRAALCSQKSEPKLLNTEAAAIKEEVLSQPGAGDIPTAGRRTDQSSPARPRSQRNTITEHFVRKRGRDEDEEDSRPSRRARLDEGDSFVSSDTPQIKQEIITPKKEPQTPARNSSRKSAEGKDTSTVIDCGEAAEPPARGTSRSWLNQQSSPKPEVKEEMHNEVVNEFDFVPSRKRNRRNRNASQLNTVGAESVQSLRGRQSRSPSPVSQRKSPSPTAQRKMNRISPRRSPSPGPRAASPRKTENRTSPERLSQTKQQESRRTGASRDSRGKHSAGGTTAPSTSKEENGREVVSPAQSDTTDDQGFLTTRIPMPDQQARIDQDYMKEEDQPSRVMAVEETSLVVTRKQRPQQQNSAPTLWNGKRVKNYKKFRKVKNVGAGELPCIIGGRDLEVHGAAQRRDLEDWFREELQAESQQNEADKLANEMFDWEPKSRGRKK